MAVASCALWTQRKTQNSIGVSRCQPRPAAARSPPQGIGGWARYESTTALAHRPGFSARPSGEPRGRQATTITQHGPVRDRRAMHARPGPGPQGCAPALGCRARSSAALGRNAHSAWPAPGPHRLVTLPGPGRPRKSPEGRRPAPQRHCLPAFRRIRRVYFLSNSSTILCRIRPLHCAESVRLFRTDSR